VPPLWLFLDLAISVTFFASAVGKTLVPAATLQVFHELFGLGTSPGTLLLVLLLAVEFGLAAALIGGWRRRTTLAACGVFLFVVSAGVVALLATGSRSHCGCGLPSWTRDPRSAQFIALARNGLLVTIVVAALATSRRPVSSCLAQEVLV
jgi:hypothetical protein